MLAIHAPYSNNSTRESLSVSAGQPSISRANSEKLRIACNTYEYCIANDLACAKDIVVAQASEIVRLCPSRASKESLAPPLLKVHDDLPVKIGHHRVKALRKFPWRIAAANVGQIMHQSPMNR